MPIPTRQQISEAIRAVRADYLKRKLAPSYFEINNGRCYDFAHDVIDLLHETVGKSEELEVYQGENFQRDQDNGLWDGTLLRKYWKMKPPSGFTWAQLNKLEFGMHYWVTCEQRHYDAECPEGVDSFFDLPIFRRTLIEHLRENGINCPDVETEDVVPAPRCPVIVS